MFELSSVPADRRDVLKRAGLVVGGAAAVWSAPVVLSLGGRAFAAEGSQSPSKTSYDLRDYFLGTQQPTGPFSFYESNGPAVLGQLTTPRTFVGDPGFSSPASFPLVVRNNSGVTHTQGGYSNPPGGIVAHPGSSTDVLLQFLVPSTGRYRVRVSLTDAEPGRDGVAYAVYLGATPLGGGTVPDGGSDSGTFVTDAATGDTLSLVINRTATYFSDGTRVTFIVDEV